MQKMPTPTKNKSQPRRRMVFLRVEVGCCLLRFADESDPFDCLLIRLIYWHPPNKLPR